MLTAPGRASRALRVSIIPFVGRSWLSPFVPLQQPLTCVIGRPINVDAAPIAEPTDAQINAMHAEFRAELSRIFETYKGRHPGFEARRLYFDDERDDDDDEQLARVRERRSLEQFHVFPAKL